MSNTTCIKAIAKVSNINKTTVDKVYLHNHINQPQSIKVSPIIQWIMGHTITLLDIVVNISHYTKDRSDIVVENYHIWYCPYEYRNITLGYTLEGTVI